MAARLKLVYGVLFPNALEIIDFAHLVAFDRETYVLGAVLDTTAANEFIHLDPEGFDQVDLDRQWKKCVDQLVAEVEEVEGDLVTAAERNMWEAKVRRLTPKIIVGLSE